MTFGFPNAPATFMSLISGIYKSFWYSFVIIIIDDILVYSKSKEKHAGHLHIVLGISKEKHLYIKLYKYEFLLPSIAFIVYVILEKGVIVDPQKIKVVKC